MKKFLALLLVALMSLSLVACGDSSATSGSASGSAAGSGSASKPDASKFKVGAILVGDENEGYTYAHMQGIEEACKELGIDTKTNLIYKYSVPEDETCYDAAVDLAEQGCNVIFANSFGHESNGFDVRLRCARFGYQYFLHHLQPDDRPEDEGRGRHLCW